MRLSPVVPLFALLLVCPAGPSGAAQSPDPPQEREANTNVSLGVDLVVTDAQVMQRKTGRVVGDLRKEDFILYEDKVRQEITHFSQDSLPLSVVLLVDRGGCLDPLSEQMRWAAAAALNRLKPEDEVALMTFADTTELVEGFRRDRQPIIDAINRVPDHDEQADHCFDRAMYDAASLMLKAGNPDGRRVIIVVTALTRNIDCQGFPSSKEALEQVIESGSVVCGLIPTGVAQRAENGAIGGLSATAGVFGVPTFSLKKFADETGGEIVGAKAEEMTAAFDGLVRRLRTRYSLGYVSSNTKQDGSYRKLKVEVAPAVQKREGKLVVRTKRGYVAPRAAPRA
jgi:VWFA-related protein